MSVFLVVLIILVSFLGSEIQSSAIAESHAPDRISLKAFVFGISILKLDIVLEKLEPSSARLRFDVNGKKIAVSLTPDKTDKDSVANYLTSPLMKAIDIKYSDLRADIGVKNGDFAAVLIAEALRTAYCSFVSFIKSKQLLSEKHVITANGRENMLYIRFFGIIRVSPANIICSLFAAFARKARFARAAKRKVKNDS